MAKIDDVIELLKSGKLVQAKSILEENIKNDPTNIDALYNLGMFYSESGQPEKAIPLLKRCVELNLVLGYPSLFYSAPNNPCRPAESSFRMTAKSSKRR